MTPQQAPAPAAPGTLPTPVQPAGKGRILVVDDDRLVLATVSHGLAQAGYVVIDADNGDEAILLAREHRPELALLDIRMEGKSGLDVAETLRDAYRIPFIFLSAFSDPATLAQVQALGALAYLVKPLDVGQIVPSVAAALLRVRAAARVGAGDDAPATVGSGAAADAAATVVPDAGSGGSAPPAQRSGAGALPARWPGGAGAAPVPGAGPVVTAAPGALADPVPLAVGVLMHRYSLDRGDAWQRLQRLAQGSGQSPAVQAERLLAAVEELARSAL